MNLLILDPVAVDNPDRKALFEQLGVVEESTVAVRNLILSLYSPTITSLDAAQSRAHLHYLYLTHQALPPRDELLRICLCTKHDEVRVPYTQDTYLPGSHPYGPEALLASGRVSFVHPSYLENVPEQVASKHPTWIRWLHDFVGVRERLRLVSRDHGSLSDTWAYVAKHRPKKLLGMLKYLWSYEGTIVQNKEGLKAKIRRTRAERLCKPEVLYTCYLDETYLPLSDLQKLGTRFMEPHEHFPFLDLEFDESDGQLRAKWMFLNTFLAVGLNNDVQFLLDILHWIKEQNIDAWTVKNHGRLVELYIAIDAKCLGAVEQQAERAKVRYASFVPGMEALLTVIADLSLTRLPIYLLQNKV